MEVLRMLQARKLIRCEPHTGLVPSETKIESGLPSCSSKQAAELV